MTGMCSSGKLAHQMAEDGEELIVLLQARAGHRRARRSSWPPRFSARCRPIGGHAAGDRAADVEQVGIALGARADHRVREADRVRLAPGDLLAEDRAHVRLVRRAGPGRHGAHALVGEHLPRRLGRPLGLDRPVLPAAFVDAADVEAGRHRDARAERGEPLGELERRVAEIDGAVDVRLRDVHQLGRRRRRRPSARGSTSPAPAPGRPRRRPSPDRDRSESARALNYNAAHAAEKIRARRRDRRQPAAPRRCAAARATRRQRHRSRS